MPRRRRRDPKRGRRVLVWLFGCFLLGQGLIGLAFDNLLSDVRFPDLPSIVQRVRALPEQPTVLVVGSSRLGFAVDCEVLPHHLRGSGSPTAVAHSAAVSAGDLPTCAVIFRELLAGGVRPKVVFLEICPDQLCERNPVMPFQIMH